MDPRGNAQEISNAFSPCLAFTGQDGLACYFRWFFACRRRNPRYSVTNYTSLLTVFLFCTSSSSDPLRIDVYPSSNITIPLELLMHTPK